LVRGNEGGQAIKSYYFLSRGDEIFVTQTMKVSKTPPKTPTKRLAPGQRQQERLQRRVRRRKRQRLILSMMALLLLVVLVGLGIWQYQQYRDHQTQLADQHASATAATNDTHATATAQTNDLHATQTAQAFAQALTPAPDKPPAVNGNVVTLANGLQYIDIQEGVGVPSANGSTVATYYTGWLQSSGQKFDSSYDHEGRPPFSITLGQQQVIPGFEQGLVGIKSGGTRRLIIPPALAYGSEGTGNGTIPPNATLIFDITVISIK
jgi:FKBP-type peptidyl-prolyl cis-trans isomerase